MYSAKMLLVGMVVSAGVCIALFGVVYGSTKADARDPDRVEHERAFILQCIQRGGIPVTVVGVPECLVFNQGPQV